MELEARMVKKGHDKSLGGNALYLDMVVVSLMCKAGKTHRNVYSVNTVSFTLIISQWSVWEKIMTRAAFLDARSCVLELWLRYVFFWIDDFKKDLFGPSQRSLTRKQYLCVCWLLLDSGYFHTPLPPFSFLLFFFKSEVPMFFMDLDSGV